MISTHILDTTQGLPAAQVKVHLLYQPLDSRESPSELEASETDSDGRIVFQSKTPVGNYQLRFEVQSHFSRRHVESFYETICIDFILRDPLKKYHVPLLLNPYGYSTYRGS